MALRPVPMQKVGFLALRDDEERILTLLHDLRVAQVEPLTPAAMAELAPERGSETLREIGDQALRFRGLLAALPPTGSPTPVRFASVREILAATKTVPIDEEVGRLKREDDRLLTEAKEVRDTLLLVDHLSFYSDRLEYLRGASFLSFYGEGKPEALPALRAELAADADAQFIVGPSDEKSVRFLVALRTSGAEALSRTSQTHGIRLVAIPPLDGTPEEERRALAARQAGIEGRRTEIGGRLREIAAEWYPAVASIAEALEIENRKSEILAKLGAGRSTFALEAWVPKRDVVRLRSVLQNATAGRVYFYDVAANPDDAPTVMSNPQGVRRFEFFIRFYSLPQPTEWDPTLIFAIVFPVLFGLMLGDWGYGLTILLICIWMIRGFPGAQHLPKSGRNFVKLIMGPKGMQQLAWALLPGCLLAIALGLYFDAFFGFPLFTWAFGYTSPVNPLANTTVTEYLLIGLYFGLVMVSLGFLLGALKAYFHHHRREMLGKIGGIAFAIGIVIYGLSAIHYHALLPPITTEVALGFALLGLGIALLLVGEGAFGILGLIDIVSHVLSYTRIVGILLASVVLALVINAIGVLVYDGVNPHLGLVIGVLIAAVIIVGGQAFNVILGVFEPGIQGARLIFVEHFSKYYTGNGKPFRPFGAGRTHTLSSLNADGTAPASAPYVRGPNS